MEEDRSLIEDATTSLGAAIERGLGIGRRGRIEEEVETGGVDDDDSSRRGKLLLGVANVGGSLTWLLRIALLAWGVRRLRSIFLNRPRPSPRPVDRVPFAMLSAVAVRRMVELDPVQYVFMDVRYTSAVKDSPAPFEAVLNIPETELSASLQLSDAQWEAQFPSRRKIGQSELIIFLSTKGHRAERAAKIAADLGYSGCCVLSGGIEAYAAAMSTYVEVPLKSLSRGARPAQSALLTREGKSERFGLNFCGAYLPSTLQCIVDTDDGAQAITGISWSELDAIAAELEREQPSKSNWDAVATLLGKHESNEESTESGSSSIHLLDVRRDDERKNFGYISVSKNIPVTELPKALTLDEVSWKESYHFPKFSEDDTVIFQCRINGRASWAAQLAQDAGLKQCFVYKEGIQGWRLDPTVQPYDAYKLGGTPPDPIQFEVETVDHEAALKELQQKGLG